MLTLSSGLVLLLRTCERQPGCRLRHWPRSRVEERRVSAGDTDCVACGSGWRK